MICADVTDAHARHKPRRLQLARHLDRPVVRRRLVIGVADHHVEVIVVGQQSSGRQGALLHEIVMGCVTVSRAAPETLRFCGLCPVEAKGAEVVAERNGSVLRGGNRIHSGDQAIRGQSRQGLELRLTTRAVCDARVFVDVL